MIQASAALKLDTLSSIINVLVGGDPCRREARFEAVAVAMGLEG